MYFLNLNMSQHTELPFSIHVRWSPSRTGGYPGFHLRGVINIFVDNLFYDRNIRPTLDRRITVRHVAENFDIIYSTGQAILSNRLRMRCVSIRWVPQSRRVG